MRVLVFGGTGLIGAHVVEALAARGVSVFVAARTPPSGPSDPRRMACDVARIDDVERAFDGARPDRVLHLAAALQFACEDEPLRAVDVNVVGTRNVLDVARRAGVARVVFGSSVAAYGERAETMREDDPASSSLSLYGAAKGFEERLGIACALRHGLSFVALRYCAVFGRGGAQSRGMAEIRRRILETRDGRDAAIAEASGGERAQLTYVDDAVAMTLAVLEAPSARHFVYNVAGPAGNYVTLREFHACIRERFPRCGRVRFTGRARSLGPVDTSRIRREFGCASGIAIREALDRMFGVDPTRS